MYKMETFSMFLFFKFFYNTNVWVYVEYIVTILFIIILTSIIMILPKFQRFNCNYLYCPSLKSALSIYDNMLSELDCLSYDGQITINNCY